MKELTLLEYLIRLRKEKCANERLQKTVKELNSLRRKGKLTREQWKIKYSNAQHTCERYVIPIKDDKFYVIISPAYINYTLHCKDIGLEWRHELEVKQSKERYFRKKRFKYRGGKCIYKVNIAFSNTGSLFYVLIDEQRPLRKLVLDERTFRFDLVEYKE